MFSDLRLSSLIALLGVTLAAATAVAQGPAPGNPYYPASPTYNTAPLGKALPPGMGYTPPSNPYSTLPLSTPVVAPVGSTVPTYGYGGAGYNPYLRGAGGALQGQAAVIGSAGQYQVQTQQASLLREQRRQMSLDTQIKRLSTEMQYEDMKASYSARAVAKQKEAVLNHARRDATDVEIWSGNTFNILLKSVFSSTYPTRGPNIPVDQSILRGLNLQSTASHGNLGMAKDEGKFEWPEPLMDTSFDDIRKKFSTNYESAMKTAQTGERPARSVLNELKRDMQDLEDKLDSQVGTLSPSDYIVSRRLVKQLKEGVKGLSDPTTIKSCNCSWKKNVRTVGDLVAHCMKNGLEFAPAAAPGDKPCYQAFYFSLRNYERGLIQYGSGSQ